MTEPDGDASTAKLLSIRYNQILGLFDRSPLATAICYADGFMVRVCNPAFAEALGIPRDELRGERMLDHVHAADDGAVERLHAAVRRRANTRHELPVHWTVGDTLVTGRVSFELVDDALIGNTPLLTYLHVDRQAPRAGRDHDLDPVAQSILEMVAAGETTASIARSVDLTVDGVNYHVGRLCRRLGATNRTALVARAYVLGVLDSAAWPPQIATSATA
jgi:DNA-binding CsgD family transcriptional regulator